MLWIALHLPLLSLEAFVATLPGAPDGGDARPDTSPTDGIAVALVAAHHVTAANSAAEARGVRAGQKRATALALVPGIVLGEAAPRRDRLAAVAVGHAALAFTPSVCFEPAGSDGADADEAPHTVLLEVEASLRYFGGLRRLLQRLRVALAPLGHRVHCGTAPTALGATLLARLPQPSQGRHAADADGLAQRLDDAPVWLVGPGREHWDALQGMGLRTLSDLVRLPRAGLARRFGERLLDELDRAYGRRPDPRDWLTVPEVFGSRLELFARADTTEQVLQGAAVLLSRLVAWCQAQHAQVRRFSLLMQHESRHRHDATTPTDSRLDVALAEPSADAAHLLVLLRERLAQLQLVAPTLELRLHCADVARRGPPNRELFPTPTTQREGLVRLIERLQARLGAERVQRLVRLEDHRPEYATCLQPADAAIAQARPRPAPPRPTSHPVWLLTEPLALAEHRSRPLLDGRPLQLLSGPERIESGWWDGDLAERDYFVAQTVDGSLVWLYRGRLPDAASGELPGWFLHGRFG